MIHWVNWLLAPLGILSSAVVFGTDMFFLTIGRSALRQASAASGTEVMGFFHLFADARMPIWGILAVLSNILLAAFSGSGQRWFYFVSVLMLILFVVLYARLAKPINQLQTEAAKAGRRLNNARELQASWDRLLNLRVPLLAISLLAQCLALLDTPMRFP
jgi:glucan phosphoethanolaminetransferase (alkaline phosphatase superfamily)